jgi:hypothetical protein
MQLKPMFGPAQLISIRRDCAEGRTIAQIRDLTKLPLSQHIV